MRITVRVTPRSKREYVAEVGPQEYEIHVNAAPEKGRATDAARRMLAEYLGVAPSRISLLMGAASRVKVFEVR